MDEDDYGTRAQLAAMDHLALCYAWASYYEDSTEPRPTQPDPSMAPFDGCPVCVVREALYAAVPILEAGLKVRLS